MNSAGKHGHVDARWVDLFEMMLDFPDATPVLTAEGAMETVSMRAGAVAVQDWPAMKTNLSSSLSSNGEDDDSCMSLSDSSPGR
jgi:hypothetical protein